MMRTIDGLEMVYDEARSSTENLYHLIYGEWPKYDCPEYAQSFLATCLESDGLESVQAFFGLGRERQKEWDNTGLEDVQEELCRVPDVIPGILEVLYAEDCSVSDWKAIAAQAIDYCSSSVQMALYELLIDRMVKLRQENRTLREVALRGSNGRYGLGNHWNEE